MADRVLKVSIYGLEANLSLSFELPKLDLWLILYRNFYIYVMFQAPAAYLLENWTKVRGLLELVLPLKRCTLATEVGRSLKQQPFPLSFSFNTIKSYFASITSHFVLV